MWSILKFIVGITKRARGDENPKVEWEFGDLGKTFTLQCTGKYAEKVTPYLNSVKTSSTLGLEDFFSGSIGSLCHCWMISFGLLEHICMFDFIRQCSPHLRITVSEVASDSGEDLIFSRRLVALWSPSKQKHKPSHPKSLDQLAIV
jgi:hypothetical protein